MRKHRRGKAKRQKDKAGIPAILIAADTHSRAGRLKEALTLYREVLDADPENLEALKNLARMSLDLGRVETAASMVLQALSSAPDETESLEILDKVLNRFDNPEARAQLLFEYSQDLKSKRLLDSALIHYRRALRMNPALAAGDTFESISLLARGELKKGWLAFEWRNTVGSLGPFTEKVWNGEALEGKTVLVWGEQGIGDQIMFSTCLPDIIERAGHVIIGVDKRLVPLFARSFPKASVQGVSRYGADGKIRVNQFDWLNDYPTVDFFVLEGSLPRFFRPTIDSFPPTSNRLIPDPDRVKYWHQELTGTGFRKKVGIGWRSLLMNEDRAAHYPALDLWQPLFDRPDTDFVNLQAGLTPEEERLLKERFGIELTVFGELDLIEDFDDTAALAGALSGVVTTLSGLQWLAAAVGTPTWSVARGNRDTQWAFLGEKHFPWFPELNICLEEEDALLALAFQRAGEEIPGP